MKRYINLRFKGFDSDYTQGITNNTYIEARPCERIRDFGKNDETLKFFDAF